MTSEDQWLQNLPSARDCDACGMETPRDELREVLMMTCITEIVPGCEITPHRIYWCCALCTTAHGEYVPGGMA